MNDAGKLIEGSVGMRDQGLEDGEIDGVCLLLLAVKPGICREGLPVELALLPKGLAGFGELIAMVKVLDGLLEADGDAEADNDGCDMDEEVAPGVDRGMGSVNVDHRGLLLLG